MENIRFMWNGIKVNGKLFTAWYSGGQYDRFPDGTITIYAREYDDLPAIEGLNVENHTDMQSDYFERDRIRVTPENVWYPKVHEAMMKHKAHCEAVHAKRVSRNVNAGNLIAA